jgi:phospholipase D1/2
MGLKEVERSIELAYLELIGRSKHYIYIENQFFVSRLSGEDVKNGISEAILNRITKADADRETFRVFLFLPLLPGFEGEIWEKSGNIMKIQLGLQLLTLFHSPKSLFAQLIKKGIDPGKYIQVLSLRTHDFLEGVGPITEQIYIHSKLMIVDDQTVLIGSANINDRSMLGTRDSEVAIVIEDQSQVDSIMMGKKHKAGTTAFNMRQARPRTHFRKSSGQRSKKEPKRTPRFTGNCSNATQTIHFQRWTKSFSPGRSPIQFYRRRFSIRKWRIPQTIIACGLLTTSMTA